MTESNRPLPLTRRVLSPESQTRPVGPCCGSRTHLAGLEDRDLADRPSMDGAVGWNRTSGLHVTNVLLCRLSYDSGLVLAVGRARPKAARSRLPFGAAVARRANQREPLRFQRLIRPGRYARSSVETTWLFGLAGAWRRRMGHGSGPGAGTRRNGIGGDDRRPARHHAGWGYG